MAHCVHSATVKGSRVYRLVFIRRLIVHCSTTHTNTSRLTVGSSIHDYTDELFQFTVTVTYILNVVVFSAMCYSVEVVSQFH